MTAGTPAARSLIAYYLICGLSSNTRSYCFYWMLRKTGKVGNNIADFARLDYGRTEKLRWMLRNTVLAFLSVFPVSVATEY